MIDLKLTQKEQLVVNELKQGKTDQAIANTLGMRIGTVRTHLRSIYMKLGVKSRAELIVRLLGGDQK